jgi:SecD/SecF fusion protein
MQNKGLVKVFAALLCAVCLFYISFSFVTRHYMNKAKEYAKGNAVMEQSYLDSISNEKVFLWNYTFKDCREMEISLGLDLKGGMNVILEVSVPDVIKTLANNNADPIFNKALAQAAKEAETSQDDVISIFVKDYHRLAPSASLARLFATQQLKGKVQLQSSDADVMKALREEVQAAVSNSYNVLRARIDAFGVVQPNIQELKGNKMGRILVELPGIKEPERVRKLLQGSANLEFWETYDFKEVSPIMQTVDDRLRGILSGKTTADSTAAATPAKKEVAQAKSATSAADSLAAVLKGKKAKTTTTSSSSEVEAMKKAHPLLSLLQLNPGQAGPIVGLANAKDTVTINRYLHMPEIQNILPKDIRLMWGVKASDMDPKAQTFELYAIRATERDGRAPLGGDVITDAKQDYDQYGKPDISMSMNTDGARRWAQLTKQNINKAIAIVLDGYVYSAPNVQNEITGGNSQITGHFSMEEAKDLANVLKSGRMPAPSKIVQEDIVGPSLGQASINAGIMSFIVALILLMIYMCVAYGFIPGMIANGALFFNLFFTIGVLSSFQAALTMSGIAGMVLSLGMAVDANVLIYERTKEELRLGKGTKKALAEGYSNAFSAIFDSNLTSIITAIILFYFGTGPIRGFATTLFIGICASFFTAVFMTRLVYEHFMNKDKWLNLQFCSKVSKNMMQNCHFRFVETRKRQLTIVGILIVLCVGVLSVRGLSQSIDFTGGRDFKVQFENKVQPEQVRNLIASKFGDATVSVIAIGTDGRTVRISTNYRIHEESTTVDSEIEAKLYDCLKPLLTKNISLATFIDRENRTGGSIISSAKVGPSIADDMKVAAFWSVLLALLAIGLYILLRFRNIAYSVGSVLALATDTIMILGIYSICWGWMPFSLEIDQTFIGAILTVIGYSINDKVVIFDRVREYFHLYPKRSYKRIFNGALNSTLGRTVNTSGTTLVVLICIFVLGGDSIRSFAFAMGLGVIIGTLSSLFVSSPIAYYIFSRKPKAGVSEEEDDEPFAQEVEATPAVEAEAPKA